MSLLTAPEADSWEPKGRVLSLGQLTSGVFLSLCLRLLALWAAVLAIVEPGIHQVPTKVILDNAFQMRPKCSFSK